MDVHYSNTYDLNNLLLIEVPQNYLEDFKASKNNLKLKGNDNLTIICTEKKSYELKYVYTTNNILLLENSTDIKMDVSLVAQHTLEVTDYLPRRSHIYKLLKKNCLNYNKFNGATNIESKHKTKFRIKKNEYRKLSK